MRIPSLLSLIFVVAAIGCSSGYHTENGKVYWHGFNEAAGKTRNLVPGADASTFEVLSNKTYGKDSKNCFYRTELVVNADADSFVSLTGHYAKDKRHAYRGSQIIPGSDAATFEIIDEKWSKDKNRCYANTDVVDGADSDSFRVIGGYLNSWAADKDTYFYNHERVPLNDFASFEILDGGFSKDDTAVFYEANLVVGADTRTFQMVEGTYIGRDKNSFYRFGKRFRPGPEFVRKHGRN